MKNIFEFKFFRTAILLIIFGVLCIWQEIKEVKIAMLVILGYILITFLYSLILRK